MYLLLCSAGAKEALTPSDVIAESDITFSCVSDPQAAKDLVFGNCGVLQKINTTKVTYLVKNYEIVLIRRSAIYFLIYLSLFVPSADYKLIIFTK